MAKGKTLMVYVDDMMAPYRGMKMCHLIADSKDELLAMVDAIGVQRKWIQHEGKYSEHFDICVSKRNLAFKHGALAITWSELGAMLVNRRVSGELGTPESHCNLKLVGG